MLAQDGCQRLAEAQKLGRRAVASNAASLLQLVVQLLQPKHCSVVASTGCQGLLLPEYHLHARHLAPITLIV